MGNMKPQSSSVTIDLPLDAIPAFCAKWKVREFSLFGSVLREDFRSDSDVDVLIVFEEEIPWSLFDWIEMTEELKTLFGREVHVFEQSGLRNPFRRQEILRSKEVIYASTEV